MGGIVAGAILTVAACLTLIWALDITFGPPGYPHFTEKSAKACVIEWARVAPFPEDNVHGFTITTEGSMFTRGFRVTFFGDPDSISQWVSKSPGVSDAKTVKDVAEDGTITYEIPAGGGAVFAELVHHPARGTVLIHTYWS